MRQVATGLDRTSRAPLAPWPGGDALALDRPASPRRRRTERRTTPALRLALAAGVGALIFLALLALLDRPAVERRSLDTAGLAASLGLGVDQVEVAGHRQTPDQAIFDALDLPNIRTQLDVDIRAVKARIERLPWVETAVVSRILPDGLAVEIRERTPVAVWHHEGRAWLIDRTGRRLGPSPADVPRGLVHLAGLGASEQVAELNELLSGRADFARKVTLAERVATRRWTLELENGAHLLLPAENPAAALDRALAGQPGGRLIDRPRSVVDLRVPSRVFVSAVDDTARR